MTLISWPSLPVVVCVCVCVYQDDDEDFFDTYDSRRTETTDNRNRGIQGDGDARVVFGRKA